MREKAIIFSPCKILLENAFGAPSARRAAEALAEHGDISDVYALVCVHPDIGTACDSPLIRARRHEALRDRHSKLQFTCRLLPPQPSLVPPKCEIDNA